MSPLLSLVKAVPFWSGSQLKFTFVPSVKFSPWKKNKNNNTTIKNQNMTQKKDGKIAVFLQSTVLGGRRMAFGYPVLSQTPRCCLSAPANVAM